MAEQVLGSLPGEANGPKPSFEEGFRVWAKIGLTNFGGPAGQIALMHRILVDEKRWIDETRFLHALNYCMLLPGPEAQQLATYVGWLLHGVRGGIAAGTLFILPGFLVLLALSIAYVALGEVPIVQGILFGLKAAVLAIVAEALVRVAKRALKSKAMVWVAVAAFVGIALLHLPFPLIIAAAAVFGFFTARQGAAMEANDTDLAALASEPPNWRRTAMTALLWGAIWLVPTGILLVVLGRGDVFVEEALFFSKTAMVTFGGAYAVLAYVAQQAVEVHHWLAPDEMLTGLGLAETTPGPLILVLVFVGFLGAFRAETGLDPYLAGTLGAVVTAWVTFAPSFLWIFLGAPFVEHVRGKKALSGALAAITAAVVGVIANLAIWFGLHVLFAHVGEVRAGPVFLPIPDLATFDWAAALIALASLIAILRFHIGIVPVILAAAAAGAALKLI